MKIEIFLRDFLFFVGLLNFYGRILSTEEDLE